MLLDSENKNVETVRYISKCYDNYISIGRMLLYFLVEKYSTYHLLRNTKKETTELCKNKKEQRIIPAFMKS